MKATYDPEANALYVYTDNEGPVYFVVEEKHGYVDYNKEGQVLGYEYFLSDPMEIYNVAGT